MKRLCSKLIIAVAAILMTAGASAHEQADTATSQLPTYMQRIINRETRWSRLMPRIFTVQYAGGIGMFSAGIGWEYGRSKQWETHLMIGFTPKRYNYHTYWTLTLREMYNLAAWSERQMECQSALCQLRHQLDIA